MGSDNNINLSFFLLIVITGVLTTLTDLRHQKINNSHLIIVAIAAVALTVIKGFSNKALPMLQLSSGSSAIIIAWFFYKNDLWRGGDAKLFVLFSFMMPATGYESRIFLPSFALFANAFITGLIFLCLLWMKGLLSDQKADPAEDASQSWKPKGLVRGTLVTFCLTWVIFPIFHACGLTRYGGLSFLSIYLINVSLGKRISILMKNVGIASLVFACGLYLRYKFSADFFLWKNILPYLSTVIFYSALSFVLIRATKHIARSDERIAFSPFLFLGCLLSYTHFLSFFISLQKGFRV